MRQTFDYLYDNLKSEENFINSLNNKKENENYGNDFLNVMLSYGKYFERIDYIGRFHLKPFYNVICKDDINIPEMSFSNENEPCLYMCLNRKGENVFYQKIPKDNKKWLEIIDKVKDIYDYYFIDINRIDEKQMKGLLIKYFRLKNKNFGKSLKNEDEYGGLIDSVLLDEKGVPKCYDPYYRKHHMRGIFSKEKSREELFKYILENPKNRMEECFEQIYDQSSIIEIISMIDKGLD